MFVDPLGLSDKDVDTIHKEFDKVRDKMTKEGLRNANSLINNALSKKNAVPYVRPFARNYLVCYEQTEYMTGEIKA